MTDRLASEDVIINAPLSYAGSLQRILRLRRNVAASQTVIQVLFVVLVIVPLVAIAWSFVTFWYFTFGILLVPYRILRRGARKRKKEALRHREMMGAISSQQAPVAAPEPYRDPALARGLAPAPAPPLAIEPAVDEIASA